MHTIDVIYEDPSLIIVNKPPDVGIDGAVEPTVRSLLEQRYPGETLRNVHQLDHATSGCYCLARTPEMARRLSKLFERRKVEKTYLALVQGWMQQGSEQHSAALEIRAPIKARSKEQGEWWKMCIPEPERDQEDIGVPGSTSSSSGGSGGCKSAITQVRVLQRGYLTARAFDLDDDPHRIPTLPSSVTSELIPRGTTDASYWSLPQQQQEEEQEQKKEGGGVDNHGLEQRRQREENGDRRVKATLVMLTPLTGRRHQLRVHMQYIGHPIIGDYHYQEPMTPTSRMMLHAWRIGFPMSGYRRLPSPLPLESSLLSSVAADAAGEKITIQQDVPDIADQKREGIFVECSHSFYEFLSSV